MENKKTNKLINETSPYLLQHANNPVDWYPWGEEAFTLAKEEDKPIFLSIGYSTCHWCHVMAHESFEDEEVAELLNENFISIKVDREERPDIDSIYMNVIQNMTGSGGWPLTIVMTPEKKPFYAATYLPKHGVFGRIGIIDLLENIKKNWKEKREVLIDSGNKITEAVANSQENIDDNSYIPTEETIERAIINLESRFDENYGGFGDKPKFPTPHNILFLLHSYKILGDKKALEMAEKTLLSMYQGGIYDHIGFGFSRYSTDEKWLAPHFEKMLYDNALLVIAYSEAYQITKKEIYKFIVESTLKYIEKEMTDIEGGFYSAQDADSEGEEGKYYTWEYDEIINILGEEEGREFSKKYNITENGNFEGKNILNLIDEYIEIPDEKLLNQFNKLYQYRIGRYDLHKDDKILISWNGMMIAAYAAAGRIFKNNDYINSSKKAYDFIEKKMTKEDGSLYISYRDGKVSGDGLLDDYAYLLWGSLELYNSSFDTKYLKKSKELYIKIVELFSDDNNGFYLSSKETKDLIYRPKEFYDGAVPSGNSVLAYVLGKLSKLTGDIEIQDTANEQLAAYNSLFENQPIAYTFALKGLLLNLYPTKELVGIVEKNKLEEIKYLISEIYTPQLTTILITEDIKEEIEKISSFTKGYIDNNNGTEFYLCENFSCLEPVDNIEKIIDRI